MLAGKKEVKKKMGRSKGLDLIAKVIQIKKTKIEKEKNFVEWFRKTNDSRIKHFLKQCGSREFEIALGLLQNDDFHRMLNLKEETTFTE